MNSQVLDDLYLSDAEDDGWLYLLYVAVNPPQEKDSLSDVLSSLSDSAIIPERFQKLSLAKTTAVPRATHESSTHSIEYRLSPAEAAASPPLGRPLRPGGRRPAIHTVLCR